MSATIYTARVASLVTDLNPAWVLAGQNAALQAEYDIASILRDEICEDMAAATTNAAKQAHADLYAHVTGLMGEYGSFRVH